MTLLASAKSHSSTLTTVETGAGLSTLAFLCSGVDHHIAIAPDAQLQERIVSFAEKNQIGLDALEFHCDRSETILPEIAKQLDGDVSLALIDGGHGMLHPFVDFCYCNAMLREGGHVIIDDVQLYPPRLLAMFLSSQPGWEHTFNTSKTHVFRKTTDDRYTPDFGGQPFVLHNSLRPVQT